jgi:hypothetical protein
VSRRGGALRGLAALAALVLVPALAFLATRLLEAPAPARQEPEPGLKTSPVAARRQAAGPPVPGAAPAAPGQSWNALNNSAVERLASAGDDVAELQAVAALLEQCHAAEPEQATFRANLAEALARWAQAERDRPGADHAAALARLERAAALAPERGDLPPLIERWRREQETERDFARYGSLYFELSFDGEQRDLLARAVELTEILDRAYGELRERFQHDPNQARGTRLRVVIYTPEAFHAVTGLGHWAAGAFDGSVRVPIRDLDRDRPRWERTLRHELVHAFLDSLAGRGLPGWLNEGLAQWHEGELGQQRALARRALGNPPLELSELAGNLGQSGDPARIGQAYAQALLFTDFLIGRYGESGVAALLAGIGAGQSAAQAFERALGLPLAEAHPYFLEQVAQGR